MAASSSNTGHVGAHHDKAQELTSVVQNAGGVSTAQSDNILEGMTTYEEPSAATHVSASTASQSHQQQQPQPAVAVAVPSTATPAQPASVELLDLDLLNEPVVLTPSHSPVQAPILPSSSTHPPIHPTVPVSSTQPQVTTAATAPPPQAPQTTAKSISDAFADLMMEPGKPDLQSAVEMNPHVMPLVIVTAEFGKRWGTTPFEVKHSIPCAPVGGVVSLDHLRRAMPQSYHHVESIPMTQEAIFAATVTSTGSIVLVHTKVSANKHQCDIVVKSNAQDICTKEAAVIAHAIASFRQS